MNKKAMYKVNDLLPLAIVLVVGIVALTVGADITQDIRDDQAANSAARNVSDDGLTGFTTLGGWLPTIGLVIAAALIIGILVSSFKF